MQLSDREERQSAAIVAHEGDADPDRTCRAMCRAGADLGVGAAVAGDIATLAPAAPPSA